MVKKIQHIQICMVQLKIMSRRTFITLNAYARKEESFKTNCWRFHFKHLEKKSKFKGGGGKVIVKIRMKINGIDNWQAIEKINIVKNRFS